MGGGDSVTESSHCEMRGAQRRSLHPAAGRDPLGGQDVYRAARRRGQDVSCAARRRGISLLEVLISMFVMLVGVISVFSLVALGRFEMLEGSKADRAMTVARSAGRR